MQEPTARSDRAAQFLGGAVLATLTAVAAHVLGVQGLLRTPDLALYLPAALVGGLLGASRARVLLWVLASLLALLCLGVSYTPAGLTLGQTLIRRDSLPGRVDAIAVLSMGITPTGTMRSETLDRLLTGLALAKKGVAPVLMVSREQKELKGKVTSDARDLQGIVALASPPARVIFVDSISTTRTEALRMAALMRANRWGTVAVVTSPMHTRRACATFEAVGVKVVCVPALIRGSGLYAGANAEDRLRAFRFWLYETFATETYKSRGWIR